MASNLAALAAAEDEPPPPERAEWPTLAPAAYHGPLGDYVQAVAPETEADPAAILGQLLAGYGCILGRGPHFMVGATRHGLNIFTVIVGGTGDSKGQSWGEAGRLLGTLDPDWRRDCVDRGISSGEGLVWRIRDPIYAAVRDKKTGQVDEVKVDDGVEDKRLLVVEAEFASTLRVMARVGNTASAIFRLAWDGDPLRIMTKNNSATATDPHVAAVGHVTPEELARYLSTTEAANGFANRIAWLLCRRQRFLPEGGEGHRIDLGPILRRLRAGCELAARPVELRRSTRAREAWARVYPALATGRPGLLGAVTARAAAQVTRLAGIYAMADASATIAEEHLAAGLALWEYAEASAKYIFGDALGDPTADAILSALRSTSSGLTRTDIRDLFGRHKSTGEIDRALGVLLAGRHATPERNTATGGRPVETWRATK